MTWQVVHAQLPPQACSSKMRKSWQIQQRFRLPVVRTWQLAMDELNGVRLAVDDEGDFWHIGISRSMFTVDS